MMATFLRSKAGKRQAAMGFLLLALSSVWCVPSTAADQKTGRLKLPEDVSAFIERRDGCDHFRGEDSPDAERRAQIDQELQRLCTGTDAELARLKRAYAGNQLVQDALDAYEITIEAGN